MPQTQPKPGDAILDRVMPDATPEQREAARENLRRLARLLIRVNERLTREKAEIEIRANDKAAVESESVCDV